MKLYNWIKLKFCNHAFVIEELKRNNEDPLSDDRVVWPCVKCGKKFYANYGLKIPKNNKSYFRHHYIAALFLRHADQETLDYIKGLGDNGGLVMVHHTIGRHIRNRYKLWELEWEPVIKDGVDISEHHPDAVSMRVIEAVYKVLCGELTIASP